MPSSRPSAADDAETLETDDDGALIGFKRSNDAVTGGCDYLREAAGAKPAAKGGGGGGKKKRKKKKKTPALNARTDPQCAEILAHLDATCVIDASNAESELEPCVEALKQAEYIAVDCEGVRMRRARGRRCCSRATSHRQIVFDRRSIARRDVFRRSRRRWRSRCLGVERRPHQAHV